MNKVILMGRLARDPEVRYTTGQDTLASQILILQSTFRLDVTNCSDTSMNIFHHTIPRLPQKYGKQLIYVRKTISRIMKISSLP